MLLIQSLNIFELVNTFEIISYKIFSVKVFLMLEYNMIIVFEALIQILFEIKYVINPTLSSCFKRLNSLGFLFSAVRRGFVFSTNHP